jgi:Spy/CpxP family protein refolding chaperone
MITRSLVRVALPISIALSATALACGGTATSEPATSASSAATRAPVAQGAHGQVKVFAEALGDVPMTASQRAQIEQLAAEAETRRAAVRAARRDLTLAIAAQVQSGSIDRAALQPKIDAVVAALNASQPGDRAGVERLHAILGPDQRTAFVDALEARSHQVVAGGGDGGGLRLWAEELKLSDDQRAQIKAAIEQRVGAAPQGAGGGRPWMERKARGAKWLDAFKQDRFVFDEVAPPQPAGQDGARACDRFVGMVEAAVPVLTAEQRAAAAQMLRARAEDFQAPAQ